MNVTMAGLDYKLASIALREQLSFPKGQSGRGAKELSQRPGVLGCVLLSTCNRTEVYFSLEANATLQPDQALCQVAGVSWADFSHAFTCLSGELAARHLMEVAGGLQSRVFGEDQILSQVKDAIATCRASRASDPVLETLFRSAVTAGKELRTKMRLTGVPTSAASRAVEMLEEKLGSLAGKRAIVVGNGEMGRLAASHLVDKGANVTVTLRTYHHGQTVVPAGCAAAPYDGRYQLMEGADLIISATASPHCTITKEEFDQVTTPPPVLFDLAIPRDIEAEVAECPGTSLYNIDSLDTGAVRHVPPEAVALLEKHLKALSGWNGYRSSIDAMEQVKEAVVGRIMGMDTPDTPEGRALVELAVGKAVELLSGGLREQLSPQTLEACANKINQRTVPRARRRAQPEAHHRFPLFVPLVGRRVVVVGGGMVACRRASVLHSFGAVVTVIAPTCKELPEGVRWLQRPYTYGDLEGAALAVSATDSREVNQAVGHEASKLGIPVSVADAPEECTFFFPAVCTSEGLVAGVVSRGADHASTVRAARAIRQTLEDL